METPPLSKGIFLIAGPEIDSGIYFRSVIILYQHSTNGSCGLIINKPLNTELSEQLAHLKELPNSNICIQLGGPLYPHQIRILCSSSFPLISPTKDQLCKGVFLSTNLQFINETLSDIRDTSIRICFGHCNWGAGQLEKEVLSGLWFLKSGTAQHVFQTPTDKVWQTNLREMGGKYVTLSMLPKDLSLN